MGVVECLNHKLVEPFNVLYEKEGEHQLENTVVVCFFPWPHTSVASSKNVGAYCMGPAYSENNVNDAIFMTTSYIAFAALKCM